MRQYTKDQLERKWQECQDEISATEDRGEDCAEQNSIRDEIKLLKERFIQHEDQHRLMETYGDANPERGTYPMWSEDFFGQESDGEYRLSFVPQSRELSARMGNRCSLCELLWGLNNHDSTSEPRALKAVFKVIVDWIILLPKCINLEIDAQELTFVQLNVMETPSHLNGKS
jgi:hypothetical protein